MRHIFLILSLVFVVTSCNTSTVIANNLPEREANEIVVLLASRGIDAQKIAAASGGGGAVSSVQLWNITVPAANITDALSVLNQAGLPRVKGTSLLDLFGNQGLVPSELQNKIRYQEGLSEQLAMTIRKMDGILDANVQITFPEDEAEVLTASVYVKHRGVLDNPNSLMVTKIKRLISSSLPGLSVENVSVVGDRALISEISLDSLQREEGHDLAMMWGVLVTKSSIPLLRTILYFFIIFLFLFLCFGVWMVWKVYPLITKNGLKTLFSSKPFDAALGTHADDLEEAVSSEEEISTEEEESE
ncbi:MAG: hypothetical protein S4CHLAM45_11440 [Chlamydiales bacterium]|nr:hypothetical protein [Chlamydiales bacterium]MCH9619636.1 hypothetical protein [Chlamydiales bacterium]MCH9623242.1 hypothetical protein [Chlamydiales bacterium]